MSDGVQIRPPSEWKERTFEDDMRDTRTKIMQAILDERKKIENHKKGVIRSNLRIEKLQTAKLKCRQLDRTSFQDKQTSEEILK